jgi:hypothetical protein
MEFPDQPIIFQLLKKIVNRDCRVRGPLTTGVLTEIGGDYKNVCMKHIT